MKKLLTLIFIISFISLQSQIVYEHISNNAIYDFLDELANNKVIDLNSVVKPYSRMFIAEKLKEAYDHKDELSKRQVKELEFYMTGYTLELDDHSETNSKFDIFKKNENLATSLNPLAVLYKDKVFSFSIKPIWGIQFWSNESGNAFHRWGGAEMYGYIGKNLSFYTSLRDNHESVWLSAPTYLNRRQGVPKKRNPDGGVDYSEARGGLFYSWKWGSVGIAKDHIEWGNNYHGANILSTKAPSFGQIQLNLKPAKWFEFHYIHGWLVSNVVDSARSHMESNGNYRTVLYNKYIAANMFTIIPFKRLNISFGNSIIYSDGNVQLAYLVPFLFYKSVDHTLNNTNSTGQSGQNAQMFFDISSRQIKHLHLYVTLFIDEFKMDRISNDTAHNFLSWKLGFRLSDFPLKNVSLTTEYTRTNPGTYQHNISTTTFASNDYTLGHYMRSNSDEIYISLGYKPIRGLHLKASFMIARHGNDDDYYDVKDKIINLPFMKKVTWDNKTYQISARYEFINNAYVFAQLIMSDINGYNVDGKTGQDYLTKFGPELFWGKKTSVSFGFNIGF